jgi:GntR family transcriptional regulator
MSAGLHVDPGDATPLWKQVEEGLRRLVASGQLLPGSLVPSVREMAQTLQVNPATVVKAYNRLIEGGIFTSTPGLGTFVAEKKPGAAKPDNSAELDRTAERFASVAITLGASNADAIAAVRAALKRLRDDGSKGTA